MTHTKQGLPGSLLLAAFKSTGGQNETLRKRLLPSNRPDPRLPVAAALASRGPFTAERPAVSRRLQAAAGDPRPREKLFRDFGCDVPEFDGRLRARPGEQHALPHRPPLWPAHGGNLDSDAREVDEPSGAQLRHACGSVPPGDERDWAQYGLRDWYLPGPRPGC